MADTKSSKQKDGKEKNANNKSQISDKIAEAAQKHQHKKQHGNHAGHGKQEKSPFIILEEAEGMYVC
jgi:hypothetical protein